MAQKNTLKKTPISVFFPCYNDAGSIGILVEDADNTLRTFTNNYEIIVVDDGSRDESRSLLLRLAKKNKRLRLIFHKKNLGYGGALKSGFINSKKKYVFYTDGDGQYDVKEITKLVGEMRDGVDVIQGYKLKRYDPWYRIVIGRLYHYFSKILFNLKVRDVDCDFRLIKKSALAAITLEYNSGVICVELVKKLQDKGFKFKEVGVNHYPRLHGHSQFFNYRRILKTIFELVELRLKLWVQT